MKKLTKVLILLWQLAFIAAAATNRTSLETEKEALIKTLEKEKGELYKQIKTAINDSLVALVKNNDTESKMAQKHLKELDQQMKEINETDGYDVKDGRRKLSAVKSYFNENPFGTTVKTSLSPAARLKAEQDIRAWIAKINAEKAAIKKYKMRLKIVTPDKETCPDYGYNKKTFREKGKKKMPRGYPCCRKCCKSSYMGCLKKR